MASCSDSAATLERSIHISGLGSNLDLLSNEQKQVLQIFKRKSESLPEVQANLDYVDESALTNFLVARDWDIPKATKMLVTALQWRMKRPCHRWHLFSHNDNHMSNNSDKVDTKREELFNRCGSTGKIRVPGTDRHGRTVMVFDNSRENMLDADSMIEFLAYNMELCKRTAVLAGQGTDKMMLFMHMSDFSIWNQPAMAVTKETITILSMAFPESLGTCVILNPPSYFLTFWNLVKGWIDPKTASKVIFVNGNIEDGSPNDVMMRNIICDDWKRMTGGGMPVSTTGYSEKHGKQIAASPGYDHTSYWPTVLDREARYLSLLVQNKESSTSLPHASTESSSQSSLPSDGRKGQHFKMNHDSLSQSTKYNKLVVGGRPVLEFNGEKWAKMRQFSDIPDDFLDGFDWQTLKKEKIEARNESFSGSGGSGGGKRRLFRYVAYSPDNKYVVRELSNEFHTWLLCSSLSYIDHVIPRHVAQRGLKHSDIESMEDDSLLFRIYAHFKEESSGKIFVVLANGSSKLQGLNKDTYTINEIQVSMHDYIEKKSFRAFMSRKNSSAFGLYKNEEDDSWGLDLDTRIQHPFLVQRSEFASFLMVLERDLRWLESSGGIGVKLIVASEIYQVGHQDGASSPRGDNGVGDIPPFVCMNEEQTEVHTQHLAFLTFPTTLAQNKAVSFKYCSDFHSLVASRFYCRGLPLLELSVLGEQDMQAMTTSVSNEMLSSSALSRQEEGFTTRDFLLLVMSAPAFTWLIDQGPLASQQWLQQVDRLDLLVSNLFRLIQMEDLYNEVIKSTTLQRYIQCAIEVVVIITFMLTFSHFAASAAVGDGHQPIGSKPIKSMLGKFSDLAKHTLKLFWDVLFLSTLITFTAFTLSALTRGNNKGVGDVNDELFSVEFAENAVHSARLWAPRFVAINAAFLMGTRILRD